MSEILQYDLLTNNSLFEGQSPLRPDKNKIVTKLVVDCRWLLTLYPRIELY